ncbi:MAG: glucan 1,4-alpha-glucosidase [Actinobacteria bacterium]|nr:glucan 1,4-alpha-glucosidase [Actinomycetota bacterium]
MRLVVATLASGLLAAVPAALPAVAAAAAPPGPAAPPGVVAPGAPGALSHLDLARKDCVGTAASRSSRVWYTVAGGELSDVYSPTVDNTNVESMRYLVTDGRTFTDVQDRDMSYQVRSTDRSGMVCEVTAAARSGRYRIITRYLTDPRRDAVVMSVRFTPDDPSLRLYLRLDPSVNGNGGGGTGNGGADSATSSPDALVAADPNVVTNAANRDYAVPTALALRADRPFTAASSGYAGSASDGATQLDLTRRLEPSYVSAPDGNVVLTAGLDTSHGPVTLALGFGRDAAQAVQVAGAAAHEPFGATLGAYTAGWAGYDSGLRPPPTSLPGLTGAEAARLRAAYWLSANVLKASEDKTFPGAVVASLASPWGQAVSAGDTPDGHAPFLGSYREVFARDLYESFTGLLAAGDLATARDTVRFLFDRQQLADGRFPRNSLLNGAKAPDTGGDQLDESAYPILMAHQAGLGGDSALWPKIRKAADFVVAHGPSFGSERWEEQGGYSPSTIAAEIAGLVAAGRIAQQHGDAGAARVYRATADHFQRSVRGWTVTSTGPYGAGRYFLRLSRTGDPNQAVSYHLGNGSVSADQREVVDAGFLELVRLGILPATDPDVAASLPVVDAVIGRDTPSGRGYYRYGTGSAGTEDGYGDCYEPDPTSCSPSGRPWPTGNAGSGHLWPVLTGERAEQQLQTGDTAGAVALLAAMNRFSSGVGLVPEQVWEDPALAASPYGSAPETASIGFATGQAAGSASPLTWTQAEQLRLTRSIGSDRPVEQPSIVRSRYVDHTPPATLPVTVTAPADGTLTQANSVEVTGTSTPGVTVTVAATPIDMVGDSVTTETTTGADGGFMVTVPLRFGANVLTVAASTSGSGDDAATGYARVGVNSDAVPGTVVLDTTDPTGDDNGPGTYAYPTATDFVPGAFDLTRFQVIDGGDTVYLRATLRNLTPTWGSPLGAQLLDVFVRDPATGPYSTAAPYPTRSYALAADSAWSRMIEVQGFHDPVFTDAAGAPRGPVTVTASQASRSVTIAVPAAALGHPGSGWVFTVVLHGQDGYSADQARGFAPTAQPYAFGLCAAGGTSPICAIDPATAPKVMDTIPPAGVDQAAELDPTRGPVAVRGLTVQ